MRRENDRAADTTEDSAVSYRDPRESTPVLSKSLRGRLRQIADAMIPATEEMPAASEVGVASFQLALVLEARPDLLEPLKRALSQADPNDPLVALEHLAKWDPEAHAALILTVLGGYYLSDEVTDILGYPGREAEPVRPDTYPPYVAEGLLDGILDRGPRYRTVTDD